MSDQPQKPEKQLVQVEVGFLQAIVDYMSTKPYAEVHQFMEVLVRPQQQQGPKVPDAPLTEPEGFDGPESNIKEVK